MARIARTEQVQETRGLIMAAAERLFAEFGVAAVSNRQISEAARQGNNAAVNYHFGTKTDLLRAIVGQHATQTAIEVAGTIAAATAASASVFFIRDLLVDKLERQIERRREEMLRQYGDSPHVRDWVSCLVRPKTDHLASLGVPTWYARFAAQLMTDPALREVIVGDRFIQRDLDDVVGRIPEIDT